MGVGTSSAAEKVWQFSYVPRTIVNAPWGDAPEEIGIFKGSPWVGPRYLVVDNNENIYIHDAVNNQTKKFDKDGTYKGNISKDTETPFTVGENGNIFDLIRCPSDDQRSCIVEFLPSGESIWVHKISSEIRLNRFSRGMVFDKSGNLYIRTKQTYYRIGRVLNDKFEPLSSEMQIASAAKGFFNSTKNYRIIVENVDWGPPKIQIVRYEEMATGKDNLRVLKEIPVDFEEELIGKHTPSNSIDIEFLNQDKDGFIYIRVFRFNESKWRKKWEPKIRDEVWKYDEEGNVISTINVRWSPITEDIEKWIEVDDDGNVYQLRTEPEGVRVIKWEQK